VLRFARWLGGGMWLRGRFIGGGMSYGRLSRHLPRSWLRRGRASERGWMWPALEIDIGRDIRVRISATAPAELATAVIKVLALR
jgi:hypothetical protein